MTTGQTPGNRRLTRKAVVEVKNIRGSVSPLMAAPNRIADGLKGVNARDGPGTLLRTMSTPCGRGLAPDDRVSANRDVECATAIGGKPPPTWEQRQDWDSRMIWRIAPTNASTGWPPLTAYWPLNTMVGTELTPRDTHSCSCSRTSAAYSSAARIAAARCGSRPTLSAMRTRVA